MFNTNDDKEEVTKSTVTANDNKEVKSATVPNDVSMKENKGLDEGTTRGTMSEEEMEKRRKKLFEEAKKLIETRDKPEVIYTIKEEKLNLNTVVDLCAVVNSSILDLTSTNALVGNAVLKVYDNLAILIDQVKLLKSKQPTKQEIAEIVNKAISSYNEVNKQSMKESNLYHTQMIQMLKDLTNKVDRLENCAQKEIVKTDTQSTFQTFANGSYSSKKVNIENILNKDLECEEDSIIRNKTTQNDEVVKAIKPVKINDGILDETNVQQPLQEQHEIANAQEQKQPLEPVNQNTATMLKMGEQEEKSEQEKSLNAQEPAMQEQQPVQEQNEPSNAEVPTEESEEKSDQNNNEEKTNEIISIIESDFGIEKDQAEELLQILDNASNDELNEDLLKDWIDNNFEKILNKSKDKISNTLQKIAEYFKILTPDNENIDCMMKTAFTKFNSLFLKKENYGFVEQPSNTVMLVVDDQEGVCKNSQKVIANYVLNTTYINALLENIQALEERVFILETKNKELEAVIQKQNETLIKQTEKEEEIGYILDESTKKTAELMTVDCKINPERAETIKNAFNKFALNTRKVELSEDKMREIHERSLNMIKNAKLKQLKHMAGASKGVKNALSIVHQNQK